jgi:transposase-like protein
MNTHPELPTELEDAGYYISNEKFARQFITNLVWPDSVSCPRCKGDKVWRMGNDFRCGQCDLHFSTTSATALSRSHLKMSQWVIGIRLSFRPPRILAEAAGCNIRTARRVRGLVKNFNPVFRFWAFQRIFLSAPWHSQATEPRSTVVLGMKSRDDGRVCTLIKENCNRDVLDRVANDIHGEFSTGWTFSRHIDVLFNVSGEPVYR